MKLNTPNLEPRFHQPVNWQWGAFERVPDRHIRYGFVETENPQALIIALPGLNEFAEKYFEMAHWALGQGFGFAVIDWFGQGGSERYLDDPLKRHGGDFAEDVADLHELLDKTPAFAGTTSKIMLAHSMGGNIGLRYLAEHPSVFTCAALCAPMSGIYAVKHLPPAFADMLSGALNSLLPNFYTSYHGHASRHQRQTFDDNPLSSDPARFALDDLWMSYNPELAAGDVTFGWVYHALKSCAHVHAIASRIQTPCLFALAGKERIVDNNATESLISHMPNAQRLFLPEAQHEILMERDELRDEFLARLQKFVEENTVAHTNS